MLICRKKKHRTVIFLSELFLQDKVSTDYNVNQFNNKKSKREREREKEREKRFTMHKSFVS